MNEIGITVHGNVVTDPTVRRDRNGSNFTTFRVATTPYKRTADGRFVDGDTSFYSVIAFDALAGNVAASLRKGQPVVVSGTVANKEFVGADGGPRQSSEIEAKHVGHDLSWGRSAFERVSRAAALGQDRTADPEVQASLRAIADGGSASRPVGVDEDGVASADYEPGGASGPDDTSDPEETADEVPEPGDPLTDPYEVVDRASA
ncbi:single-stranded DNA-binding protein [Terrabacter aeriphilus]|uniref:Single-stranded DNA-binding protein n=1 Tax=Terrabacter aeriphilus TaxID=515662 RepID=A0ABP9JIH5_9MICO